LFGIRNLLNTARSGLFAQQTALNATGNNIANANTEGYSRQRVEMQASRSTAWGSYAIGSGVEVATIKRMRNEYIDSQYRSQSQSLNYWQTLETQLSTLENTFGEPSDSGLSTTINAFFDSWQDLSNDPDSVIARDSVLFKGRALAQKFNYLHSQLVDQQKTVTSEITDQASELNSLAGQIAQLNSHLNAISPGSEGTANLLDQRDKLLDRMNEIADVQVVESSNGQVTLSLGGKIFVEHTGVTAMSATQVGNSSQLTWSDGSQVNLTNGSLAALMKFRNETIPEYSDQLDSLAVDIVQGVNDIHSTGHGLDGVSGVAFFDADATGAGDIAVNSQIAADSRLIAASSDLQNGNGDIALAISQIPQENLAASGTMTISDFYAAMISQLGNEASEAVSFADGEELVVQQLDGQRQEEMGVSLDEEMTNLIIYQRAYQAAAKLVTMADEMAQTILDMV
jgi:flagellar hook-associated protein 1 FlgK